MHLSISLCLNVVFLSVCYRKARLAAALSKFLPSPLSRQVISRTPRLIVLSRVSSHVSIEVDDPSPAECQRHRQSRTRPLPTVFSVLIGDN